MIYQPPTGLTLTSMFALQRNLVDKYRILENLPFFPVDISQRSNQKLLRNFTYRIIEEMGEAYELLDLALGAVSTNHTMEAQEYITMYNEELADCWHFMLETLLASDIDESALEVWIYKLRNDHEMLQGLLIAENVLGSLIKYATYLNQLDNKLNLIKDKNMFIVYPQDEAVESPGIWGGRKLNQKYVEDHTQFFWEVTFRLTTAMNCLKTRDWHQADSRAVNIIKYNEALLEAFLAFIRLMVFTGKTELSIYNSYVYKNNINHERLKDKQ